MDVLILDLMMLRLVATDHDRKHFGNALRFSWHIRIGYWKLLEGRTRSLRWARRKDHIVGVQGHLDWLTLSGVPQLFQDTSKFEIRYAVALRGEHAGQR